MQVTIQISDLIARGRSPGDVALDVTRLAVDAAPNPPDPADNRAC